jgi:hypothetical protein
VGTRILLEVHASGDCSIGHTMAGGQKQSRREQSPGAAVQKLAVLVVENGKSDKRVLKVFDVISRDCR